MNYKNNNKQKVMYMDSDGKWKELDGSIESIEIQEEPIQKRYIQFDDNELSFEFKLTRRQFETFKQLIKSLEHWKKIKKGKRYVRVIR